MAGWMSEDPLGFAAGDANLYRYVGNDPVNATDPSGKEPITAAAVGGIVVLLIELAGVYAAYDALEQYEAAEEEMARPAWDQQAYENAIHWMNQAQWNHATAEIAQTTAVSYLAGGGFGLAYRPLSAFAYGVGTPVGATLSVGVTGYAAYYVGSSAYQIANSWSSMNGPQQYHAVGQLTGQVYGGGTGFVTGRGWVPQVVAQSSYGFGQHLSQSYLQPAVLHSSLFLGSHGVSSPSANQIASIFGQTHAEMLQNMPSLNTSVLNLGSGYNPMPGVVNVDILPRPGAIQVNPNYPLPFADGQFTTIHSINPRYWINADMVRILQPGGQILVSGTHNNHYARPMTAEQASSLGLTVVGHVPLVPAHQFGVPTTTVGQPFSAAAIARMWTTIYLREPPSPSEF
jgi:hypothetical protein